MPNILILGAGKSSVYLVDYFMQHSHSYGWKVRIGDLNIEEIAEKIRPYPRFEACVFDIRDEEQRKREISWADLVISLLPMQYHETVALCCVDAGAHLLTASYAKEALVRLGPRFAKKDVMLLMEMGLDPGIDHMIAMKMLDRIRGKGHRIVAFEAFTGAFIDENAANDNPWHYKFTWSPTSVVLAGQEGGCFIQEGKYKYIPYHKLFRRTEVVYIPEYGYFEGYANRDSVQYRDIYQLQGIKTLYRGTLRPTGFCRAWNIFVQIGATSSLYTMHEVEKMTHRSFINSFLFYHSTDSVELKLAHAVGIELQSEEMNSIKWLDMFEDVPVGIAGPATPAMILEHILKKKWTISEQDRDKVLMWEKIHFIDAHAKKLRKKHAYLVTKGEDRQRTAIAKTVGLSLGIAARLVLGKHLTLRGLQLPTCAEIYEPVLEELSSYGVYYYEKEVFEEEED